MRHVRQFRPGLAPVLATTSVLLLAACGQRTPDPIVEGTDPTTAATQAEEAAAARDALVARERELAEREAELHRQQQEVQKQLEEQEAQAAAAKAKAEQAARAAASRSSTQVQSRQPTPSATLASNSGTASATSTRAPAPQTYVVPAGTALDIELLSEVNTKEARVGRTVEGRLQSPVMAGDRRVIEPGARVTGTITEVVSGSHKVGGIPTVAVAFESIAAEDGTRIPVSARFAQSGKSETARDTAKILGGAAVGAVIGRQVTDSDKGTIIGGVLGGAAGTAAAKNTGGEVVLPAGTVIRVTTESSFQVVR
jgi:hypothetical protein